MEDMPARIGTQHNDDDDIIYMLIFYIYLYMGKFTYISENQFRINRETSEVYAFLRFGGEKIYELSKIGGRLCFGIKKGLQKTFFETEIDRKKEFDYLFF